LRSLPDPAEGRGSEPPAWAGRRASPDVVPAVYSVPAAALSSSSRSSCLRSALANEPLMALAASRWRSPAVSASAAAIRRSCRRCTRRSRPGRPS